MRKSNTQQFIVKARKIHGRKYGYSKVKYIGCEKHVLIECRKHGTFKQTPHDHLAGKGCCKCGRLMFDKDEFVRRANKVHKSAYSYDKFKHVNSRTKGCVTCPEHGEFWVTPNQHVVRRTGCTKCFRKRVTHTVDWFISESKNVHGDKYDYSLAKYNGIHKKVTLVCRKHGNKFQPTPANHIWAKHGCPQCKGDAQSKRRRKSLDQFVRDATKIHGKTYDYSKVKYITAHNKINIGCRKHGIFLTKPNVHLNGSGCPRCNSSHGEIAVRSFLKKKHVGFSEQKTFRDCIDVARLKFDFYVPSRNILIEYNGEQHYRQIDRFGKLKDIQRRDSIKKRYAKKNGITLLTIPYTKFNQIDKILHGIL